jgi:hypothetical protein
MRLAVGWTYQGGDKENLLVKQRKDRKILDRRVLLKRQRSGGSRFKASLDK